MKEKEQDFESALEKLEKIVEGLESGELSLSEAIKKYEEGMRLSQFCTKKLHDIEKRIEVLVKDPSGNLSAKPFTEKDAEKTQGNEPEAGEKSHRKSKPSASFKVNPGRSRGGKKAEGLLF